jgi:hypothetical protein
MRGTMRKPLAPRLAAALLLGAWTAAWSPLPTGDLRAETIATISPTDLSGCSILVDQATNVATGNGGTRRSATIQSAVDAAKPGDVVCVGPGDHDGERVAVTRSGTAKAPIRIRALGEVKTAGFVVNADHVAIEGFTVSNRSLGDGQEGRAMGIYLSGTGLKALGNTAIDTEGDGIGCDTNPPSCIDVVIARNTVRGADGTGIIVAGRRILVEANDVSRSIMIKSTDADGMRFFGSDITIRRNYVHDISDREYPPGENPHTDCFQTFDISTRHHRGRDRGQRLQERRSPVLDRRRAGEGEVGLHQIPQQYLRKQRQPGPAHSALPRRRGRQQPVPALDQVFRGAAGIGIDKDDHRQQRVPRAAAALLYR